MQATEHHPEGALDACRRAYATLRASLPHDLWDEDAGRVAHARTLVMLGRADLADVALAEGGLACAIERMHLHHARDDWEAAIAVGLEAIDRHPAAAPGLRNSVASMLSGLGRNAEALLLIEANVRAEPEVDLWVALRDLVRERLADADGDAPGEGPG